MNKQLTESYLQYAKLTKALDEHEGRFTLADVGVVLGVDPWVWYTKALHDQDARALLDRIDC